MNISVKQTSASGLIKKNDDEVLFRTKWMETVRLLYHQTCACQSDVLVCASVCVCVLNVIFDLLSILTSWAQMLPTEM